MKSRIDWIDTAKGIGIILVIYGHIWFIPEWMNIWLCSFHMPLFFFLAGITYNHEKYRNFKALIYNKARTLLIPYFIFATTTLIWRLGWSAIYFFKDGTAIDYRYLIKQAIGIFAQIRTTAYGIGVWFIPCIFVAFILLHAIMRFSHGNRVVAIAMASICLVVGYLYCTYVGYKLPWSVDAAFVAVFFMTVGCVFRDKLLKERMAGNIYLITGGGIALILNIVFAALNYRILHRSIGMWSGNYGNFAYFLLAAVFGIVFTIILFGYLKLRTVQVIGSRSIYYYGLHQLLLELFNKYAVRLPRVVSGGVVSLAAATAVMIFTLFILGLAYKWYDKLYRKILRVGGDR